MIDQRAQDIFYPYFGRLAAKVHAEAPDLIEGLTHLSIEFEGAMAKAQSPIEQMLAAALLSGPSNPGVLWKSPEALENCTTQGIFLTQQHPVGKYLADFLITIRDRGKAVEVAVECDGHDFHERTREQAQHDKARDRYFHSLGIITLRYTGSEVFKDARKCAGEILKIAGDRFANV